MARGPDLPSWGSISRSSTPPTTANSTVARPPVRVLLRQGDLRHRPADRRLGRRECRDRLGRQLKAAPLSDEARASIRPAARPRPPTLPGLAGPEEGAARADQLPRLPPQAAGARPRRRRLFQTRTHGFFGVGIDAVPAQDCFGFGYPGFQGTQARRRLARPGITAAPTDEEEPYFFHFPDGNASVARLLVRTLVPAAAPRLDDGRHRDGAGRLRQARRAAGAGQNPAEQLRDARAARRPDGSASASEVTYAERHEIVKTVKAARASWRAGTRRFPTSVPSCRPRRKRRWNTASRCRWSTPTSPSATGRRSRQLGVQRISIAGHVPHLGRPGLPGEPRRLQFARHARGAHRAAPVERRASPGLPARDQHRLGRAGAALDAVRDVRAEHSRPAGPHARRRRLRSGRATSSGITVNRWPHGYAYEYNSLWDAGLARGQQPCVLARKQFGRITIANSDAGGVRLHRRRDRPGLSRRFRAAATTAELISSGLPAKLSPPLAHGGSFQFRAGPGPGMFGLVFRSLNG